MTLSKALDGRLKVRHLVVSVTVAEYGSVNRAAEQLITSQPSVTRVLQELEAILGTQLFERTATGTAPTAAGREFLGHATSIIATLGTLEQRMASFVEGSAGEVTVGAYALGSHDLLPRAIAALKTDYPRLLVRIRDATPDLLMPGLKSGEVDLAVGRVESYLGKASGLTTEVLYREPIVVITREDVAHAGDLRALDGQPWVLPLPQTALRRDIDDAFRRAGARVPEDLVECSSPTVVRDLVMRRRALGVLPLALALSSTGIRPLAHDLLGVTQQVGLIYRTESALTPAAATMLAVLRAEGTTMNQALTKTG